MFGMIFRLTILMKTIRKTLQAEEHTTLAFGLYHPAIIKIKVTHVFVSFSFLIYYNLISVFVN